MADKVSSSSSSSSEEVTNDVTQPLTSPEEKTANGDAKVDIEDRVVLKKQVTLINGIALIVGVMIGSGIFISPKGVLVRTGSIASSFFVWAGCGLLALMGSLCYCEMGTMIPKSGGEHAYLFEAFGPLPAFIFSWTLALVIRPSSMSIVALTFARYVSQPVFPECDISPMVVRKVLAAACLGEFVWNLIQYLNVLARFCLITHSLTFFFWYIDLFCLTPFKLYNTSKGNRVREITVKSWSLFCDLHENKKKKSENFQMKLKQPVAPRKSKIKVEILLQNFIKTHTTIIWDGEQISNFHYLKASYWKILKISIFAKRCFKKFRFSFHVLTASNLFACIASVATFTRHVAGGCNLHLLPIHCGVDE
mgnify:CR=1 FL=1